jgi:hypothetical protein
MEFLVDMEPKECLDAAPRPTTWWAGRITRWRARRGAPLALAAGAPSGNPESFVAGRVRPLGPAVHRAPLPRDRWKASLTAVADDEGGKTRLVVGGETEESRKLLE